MTSLAFILGCVPLALASGAGAISRRVMGTVVIGGMTAATGIAVFLIPVCFYVVCKLSRAKPREKEEPRGKVVVAPAPAPAGGGH
jgi:HAE1 family hydrophobic/amphiphilic exporter-1